MRLCDVIRGRAINGPTGNLKDKRSGACRSLQHKVWIDKSLEAVAGFAGKSKRLAPTTNGDGLKVRGFKQDVGGAGGDFRIEATHDACDGNRAACITNTQRLRGEQTLFTIKCFQLLVRVCAANDDIATLDGCKVKGVQRLP